MLKTHLEHFTKEAVRKLQTQFGAISRTALASQFRDSTRAEGGQKLLTSFLNASPAARISQHMENAFEATGLVPIRPDRHVQNSLLSYSSPNPYHKGRTSYNSGKLATRQEVQDELKNHISVVFPEEPDNIVDPLTEWLKRASNYSKTKNRHGHLLCCPELFVTRNVFEPLNRGSSISPC
jgi:hypothetical protein